VSSWTSTLVGAVIPQSFLGFTWPDGRPLRPWSGLICYLRLFRGPANQLDQPQNHQQNDGQPDDDWRGGLTPEDEDESEEGERPDPEAMAVRVRPGADRAGGHSPALAELPDPARSGLHRRTGPDGGSGGTGQERPNAHDQPHREHEPERDPDEVDHCVERGGGSIAGQDAGRNAAEVDAPPDQQADGQDQHGRGQAEASSPQGAQALPGGEHAAGEQQQDQDGQDDLERLDQPVSGLGLPEIIRLEKGHGWADRRDIAGQGESAIDQVLLDQV